MLKENTIHNMLKECEKTKKSLSRIWSQKFWNKEAERIEMEYWNLLKDRLPNPPCPTEQELTEHRIERFVRELSRKKKIANLHVGLTSSDLEDNIRIKRLEMSARIIGDALFKLYIDLLCPSIIKNVNLIAYTHLLPAGETSFRIRIKPSAFAIFLYQSPKVTYKGIRGALGDMKIQKRLKISQEDLDSIFKGKDIQVCCTQTVNHKTEFDIASWLCFQSSILAKISNDFRQMFALGQVENIQKDIGSTAIAAKKPNPWRFERVSGMAKTIYGLPSLVAQVASECLLERTLTNQSVLNHSFKEAFEVIFSMIQDLRDAIKVIKLIDQTKQCKNPKLHSEEQMLRLVKRGLPRETAHKIINERYNKI